MSERHPCPQCGIESEWLRWSCPRCDQEFLAAPGAVVRCPDCKDDTYKKGTFTVKFYEPQRGFPVRLSEDVCWKGSLRVICRYCQRYPSEHNYGQCPTPGWVNPEPPTKAEPKVSRSPVAALLKRWQHEYAWNDPGLGRAVVSDIRYALEQQAAL